MIASANSFKPMTLKQVRQRLTELLWNGHASTKEHRQRLKVAGVPEVAFRWIVPTLSRLDSNQPALIFPGVLVSHALQRLFLMCFSMRADPADGGKAPLDQCDRVALGTDQFIFSKSGAAQDLSKNASVGA